MFSSPQLHGILEKQQPCSYGSCKYQQPSSHRREQNGCGMPQKPHSQRTVTIWLVWQLPAKLQSQGWSLCDLTQSSLCENNSIPKVFDEKHQQQLYNITAPAEDNKRLTTEHERKNWGRRSPQSFEKLLYVPGNLGHTHIQELMCMPRKDLRQL